MPRNSTNTLYVGNLPEDVRRDEIKRLFSRYGSIANATLPVDYYSGVPKGFAFVQFDDLRDAEEAFERLQNHRLGHRSLRLEFATGSKKTPDEMKVVTKRNRSQSGEYRKRSRTPERRRRSRSREYRERSPVVRRRSPMRRSPVRRRSPSGDMMISRRKFSRSISRSRS